MAGTISAPLLPPQECTIWRVWFFALLASILGACGAIDYDINESSFFGAPSSQKEMAVIHFHYGDSTEPFEMQVRRMRGGVALQSQMYGNEQGDSINFTASGSMERKYFMGIEGRFSF